jgi:predicted ATPase/class 3 adenylate cyclase
VPPRNSVPPTSAQRDSAGRLLREARRRRDMTQTEVARRAYYSSHQVVLHWESSGPPWRDRSRLLSIVRAYKLYRIEADHLLTLCGHADLITESEWQEYGDPLEGIQMLPSHWDSDWDDLQVPHPEESGKTSSLLLSREVMPLAERRQVTLLRCHLFEFSALADLLSLRDLQDVIGHFHESCCEVIHRLGGHVLEQRSDGLVCCFGYPMAHEDDAQRAVRSGLIMMESMELLSSQIEGEHGIRLVLNITGDTCYGILAGRENGETSNDLILEDRGDAAIALRAYALAGGLTISDSTYRMVEGYFSCRRLDTSGQSGYHSGFHTGVYLVLDESGAHSRVAATAISGRLSPLVGREKEVQSLLNSWGRILQGWGQTVLLRGNPGIGKSRLVQVIKEALFSEPHIVLEGQCLEIYQQSPLYPVIKVLEDLFGLAREHSPEEKLEKLENALTSCNSPTLEEALPLLASLLTLPFPPDHPKLAQTPDRLRQKTLEAVLNVLLQAAEQQPILFILEDLHWADPSTLELLGLLVEHTPTVQIMELLTFRPEFQPQTWVFRDHVSEIRLEPLSREEERLLIEHLLNGESLPLEVYWELLAKTEGVPLYIEELVRLVLESDQVGAPSLGYSSTSSLGIPGALQGGLAARLDRLPGARFVAQMGSVIGQSFSYRLLQSASTLDEAVMRRSLSALVQSGLIYQRGLPPDSTYFFKHSLIWDQVYKSLTSQSRVECHSRIAERLCRDFREVVETQPEVLAHHYTEGRLVQQAISWWQKAGQRASMRAAFWEAASHLTRGLTLLKTLPDSAQRDRQEMDLQIALGTALQASKGYASPEVGWAYTRALEICKSVGGTTELVSVLRGQWWFYVASADYVTAHSLAEQLFALAESVQDPSYRLEGHRVLGSTLNFLGEFAQAHTHLEQGFAIYNPGQHRSHAFQYGTDPGVACLSYGVRALWFLGYPDQALRQSYKSLELAETLSHSHSTAQALGMLAVLHQACREACLAWEVSERTIAFCSNHRIPYWCALAGFTRGWALTEQGKVAEGLAQIQQSLSAYQATGAKLGWSWFLLVLAEAYGKAGQIKDSLQTLDAALAHVDEKREGYYSSELHRAKGELLLIQGGNASATMAEACFLRSLNVTRRQSAKSLELRTATGLARLWRARGEVREALELLSGVYSWFTEGFNTPDLQEASATLKDLASSL